MEEKLIHTYLLYLTRRRIAQRMGRDNDVAEYDRRMTELENVVRSVTDIDILDYVSKKIGVG